MPKKESKELQMQVIEKIELSSIETTAYWWINAIKKKVKDTLIYEKRYKEELAFAEIFYGYTEVMWRELYLKLTVSIQEEVNNYVPKEKVYGVNAFSQDTAINGHNTLNEILSRALGTKIPDIRLADSGSKDSVIYTNVDTCFVWYKSCGTNRLDQEYEKEYILTGDKKELEFYYLLLATIAMLNNNNHFTSTEVLRTKFCKWYSNEYKEDIITVSQRFNYYFRMLSNKELVLGSFYNSTFYSSINDVDIIGLEEYINVAETEIVPTIIKTSNKKK